jgi:hypothetical protein
VPAAFSGTCSNQAPQYVEKLSQFKAKGVKEIYVVAVNDAFVTKYVLLIDSSSLCLTPLLQGMEGEAQRRGPALHC